MRLAQRLSNAYDALLGRSTGVKQEVGNSSLCVNPLLSPYENLFAQVRPLIDEMEVVVPYGVGANGARKPLQQTPQLAVLVSRPNESMGWSEFADLMFSTWLTEPQLYIHVWKRGKKTVSGYTVLPSDATHFDRLNRVFLTADSDGTPIQLPEDEVMTLRFSRSPRDPQQGVSPASSVIVWTQLDDLVAQYQRAYFENGAVPATITFIRSSTREGFDKKRAELERGLRGAKNRNKTVYAWRQQLDDGSTGDEIEVKTIQGNNSTQAIRDLVEIIDQRLRQSIGVSPFILGDDSSAKYDNAELSEMQFTKRRVYPALVKFWSQFQHELARVLGGNLPYGINFDLDIPELTDRQRVKAETHKIQTETLISLLQVGASPAAAVEALELNDSWNAAANEISKELQLAASAQVPIGGGAEEAVEDPATESPVPGVNQDALPAKVSKTDALENPMRYEPMFEEGEELEKDAYDALMGLAEQIVNEEEENDVAPVIAAILTAILMRAKDGAVVATESLLKFEKDETIVSEAKALLKSKEFKFSDDMQDALKRRVSEVVNAFEGTMRESVNQALEKGAQEGWSQAKLKEELRDVLPKRQAELIARNEVHAGLNFGRYDECLRIADKYGLKVELTWVAHPGACDICKAMDGESVPIGEAFPDHAHYHTDDGEDVEVYWEHNVYNADGRITNPHPNCHCTFAERFYR